MYGGVHIKGRRAYIKASPTCNKQGHGRLLMGRGQGPAQAAHSFTGPWSAQLAC